MKKLINNRPQRGRYWFTSGRGLITLPLKETKRVIPNMFKITKTVLVSVLDLPGTRHTWESFRNKDQLYLHNYHLTKNDYPNRICSSGGETYSILESLYVPFIVQTKLKIDTLGGTVTSR